MAKCILVWNSSYSIGKAVSEELNSLGFEVVCRSSGLQTIPVELSRREFSAVLLFTSGNDASVFELMHDILHNYHEIKIFIAVYAGNAGTLRRFLQAGASKCIVLPVPVKKICRIVFDQLEYVGGGKIRPEISSFLADAGFPQYFRGFYYLCAAVELCLAEPDRLSDIVNRVYGQVGERFGVSAEIVERSIRHIAKRACEKRTINRLTEGQMSDKITNYELICAACDSLVRHNYLYGYSDIK